MRLYGHTGRRQQRTNTYDRRYYLGQRLTRVRILR